MTDIKFITANKLDFKTALIDILNEDDNSPIILKPLVLKEGRTGQIYFENDRLYDIMVLKTDHGLDGKIWTFLIMEKVPIFARIETGTSSSREHLSFILEDADIIKAQLKVHF